MPKDERRGPGAGRSGDRGGRPIPVPDPGVRPVPNPGANPGEFLNRGPAAVTVLRPSDLLLVRFSFRNLRWVQVGRGRGLAADDRERPAFLIADFPPQHLIEAAFAERTPASPPESVEKPPELPEGAPPPKDPPPTPKNDETTPLAPPVEVSLSANTRVVFKVGSETIPWSLDGLLDAMKKLPLSVAPHAENPFHVLTPDDHVLVTALTRPGAVKAVLSGTNRPVPTVIRAIGRSAATARVLDHRLGTEISARITAASPTGRALGLSLPPAKTAAALTQKPPKPRPPGPTETAIELPWRLQVSPPSTAGFTHSTPAVAHDGRVELWHSRLGHRRTDGSGQSRVDEEASGGRTVRAIWARDYEGPLAPKTFDAMGEYDVPKFTKSLTSRDRKMLVDESSNFHLLRGNTPWTPPVVAVDRLMLTALGGWLSSDFNAPTLPDGDFSITAWKHRATMGRDHEVKVVYAGFLYPFGHAASLIKVTERKISTHNTLPGRYAYLRQRFFIVVREQTVEYHAGTAKWSDTGRAYVPPGDRGDKLLDLAMPFSSVTIVTRVTPDLDEPKQLPDMSGPFCFVPSVAGAPFGFKLLATDREDQIVEYGGPLLFIERGLNSFDADKLHRVTEKYWGLDPALRRHKLGGQRVAFAASKAPAAQPGSPDVALDTTLAVDSLQFDAAVLDPSVVSPVINRTQDQPRFWPILRTAEVVSPAMNTLAGVAAPMTVKQPRGYLGNGFAGNATHVFLELAAKRPMSFAQQANRSGGFVTPSLSVTALSGSKGPIGGAVEDAINGTMTPQGFFDPDGLDLPAKLFGAVKLSDLLRALGPDNMPSFIAAGINRVTGFLADLQRIADLAQDIATRYPDPVDAAITALRNTLNTAAARADAVLTAIADIDSPDDAVAAIGLLESELDQLATDIEAAKAVPAALRAEAGGVVGRLRGYVASAGDIVEAAATFLSGFSLPETVSAKLSWSTELDKWPEDAPLFKPRGDGPARLELCVEVQAPTTAGGEPTATAACSITPFSLCLLGDDPFISLHIDVIEFVVRAGFKPDVNVVLADPGVEFGGPLKFVNALQQFIPFDGFSDPPYLDVDAQGIKAGFDLALPDLAIGVFSLANISLGAEARVPFIGDSLDFTFSFCTRENPFRLTVWLFGGGGFFGITVTPERCRMLEAAFEFGAAVALDFGVASGSIECMAGVYYKLEIAAGGQDTSTLTGYFRLRGEVDVLGLISASLEMYLELTYESPTGPAKSGKEASGTVTGRATLTIEVEVLFLSMSVEIECEKKFQGSDQDPTFQEVMGLTPPGGTRPWDEYCAAFAEI